MPELKVLCQECWSHIKEFHEFQQSVLKTRMAWENKTNIKHLPNNYQFPEVKIENEGYVSDVNFDDDDYFKSDGEDERQDETTQNYNLKTETFSSFDAESQPIQDSIAIKTETHERENNSRNDFIEIKNANAYDLSKQQPQKTRRGRKPKYVLEDNNLEDSEKTIIREKKRKTKQSTIQSKEKGLSAFNMEKAKESDAFIAEWKPELICDICSESTKNFDSLRKHFKQKHTTRFYIKCCERKFFRRCVLVNHIQLHLNPETHKCDICGKSSSTKHNLKLHKKVMHEDTKQLKCEICEKLFKQKVTLERHLLTHATGDKGFVCTQCGKGFVAEQLLKLHIKHVHNVDRVCDQCGKTIHGLQALKRHLMEHAGIERPKYPCDMCGLELKSTNGLKRHKEAFHNDGSTIYVCGVCGKVATSEHALWNHKKLVHVDERKFKCTYCDKAFKRPNTLREHIATHTGQDLYQCPHCPQTFKVSANMHHHRKKVHPVEWEEGRKNRLQYPKVNINQVKKQVVI